MKAHRSFLLVLIALLIVQPATAQGDKNIVFTVEPELNYTFGETQYDMVFLFNTGVPGVIGVRSLLEFPVNAFTAGVTARLAGARHTPHPWGLALTLATKVNDPAGKFRDGDWLLLESGTQFKFSYTESRQKMSLFILNFEASRVFASGRRSSFDMFLGYRFQRIVQDIYGYSGWFWNGGEVPVEGNDHALYYRVTYHSPSLGCRFKTGSPDRTLFHVQAALSPTYMKDYDDHLLRFKVGTADGMGLGISAQSGVRFNLKKARRNSPYLEFTGRFNYINGSPSQTQKWYGDDPASAEDDTGTELRNIPHKITLTQLALGARFGFAI